MFHVCLLIVELLLLFTSVALFSVFYVSEDTSPLVSAAPTAFSSGVNPLPSVIFVYQPISDSERIIPGLFLHSGFNVIEFDD